VINIFLLIVGMFMDTTPAILILTPILLPIVKGFGMTGIHFGVMMVVNLAIGYVTPPIGVNLFVASAMTDIPVMEISKKAIPLTTLKSILQKPPFLNQKVQIKLLMKNSLKN
jgi:C4-dicarboxylate transporter DctM subunit